MNRKGEWGRRRVDNQPYPKIRGKENLPTGLRQVAEKSCVRATIEQIIKDFSTKYAWHYESQKDTSSSMVEDINSGLCDLFVEELQKHYPRAIIHYDDDIDHYYSEIDGKFYDAENPHGTFKKEEMVFLGKVRGDV